MSIHPGQNPYVYDVAAYLTRTVDDVLREHGNPLLTRDFDKVLLIQEVRRLRDKCARQAGIISGLTEFRQTRRPSLTFWLGGDAP